MADATPYNMDAVRSDGFVDFYELLAVPQTASAADLSERIQALYSEAQANRDHRNLNKRRDYQTLLEYLPQARIILPDPAKRALYDDYAAKARGGSPPADFVTFVGQLSGQLAVEDNTGLLGRPDTASTRQQGSGTTAGSSRSGTAPSARTPSGTGDSTGGVARRQPQVSGGSKSGPPVAIIAVVAVVLIALVLFFVMKH